MFATLCSNPEITNTIIGKNNAMILPDTLSAVSAIITATQTNMLQNIPLINASEKERLHFATAVVIIFFATPLLNNENS